MRFRMMTIVATAFLGIAAASWAYRPAAADRTPRAPTVAAACKAACTHRASCKLPGDVAACTAECTAVSSLFTPQSLAGYPELSCDKVREVDSGFLGAVACKDACAHRASCIPSAAGDTGCLSACVSLGSSLDDLAAYNRSSCEQVSSIEPRFQAARSCTRGCQHAAKCKVPGDLSQCYPLCMQNVESGVFTLAAVDGFAKLTCKQARAQLQLPARPAPAAASAGGSKSMSPYLYIGRSCTAGGPAAPVGGMPGPTYDCPAFSLTVCCNFAAGRPATYGNRGTCAFSAVCSFPRY
jgi:hypothetical protein